MDEERIVRALREGPPNEPVYIPGRVRDSVSTRQLAASGGVSPRRMAWRQVRGSLQLAAAVAIAVAAIAVVLLVRPLSREEVAGSPRPSASSGASPSADLLAQVRASGRIRIAIRPDSPQSSLRGSLGGFDVDVADEIARRLDVAPDLIVTPVDDMLGAGRDPGWDLALPSEALFAPAAARFTATEPYYYWPVHIVVPSASAVERIGDLDGGRICAVLGSSGEAWLDRMLGATRTVVPEEPPIDIQISRQSTDAACLDEVRSGAATAAVTARLSGADLTVQGDVRSLGGPALIEERSIVALTSGPDANELVDAIDTAVRAMRSDGTLTDLSRRRFGGADLSNPPAP